MNYVAVSRHINNHMNIYMIIKFMLDVSKVDVSLSKAQSIMLTVI